MSDLTGKVAIVTGASKGIGAGIAKGLGAAGASVVVNYAASKEGADRVVAEITSKGGKAVAIQGDVSKAADVKRLFAETKQAYGTLDILVNNAGIFKFEPLEAVTETEFHRQFNTNVLGPILTIQESLNYFNPVGGSIINIGTVATVKSSPGTTIYTATKGALDQLTRVLAKELGGRKIRVNTLSPGGIETEGFLDVVGSESDFAKQMIAATPLGRLGRPDDIASIAVFLASADSGWLTGDILYAGGGYR